MTRNQYTKVLEFDYLNHRKFAINYTCTLTFKSQLNIN